MVYIPYPGAVSYPPSYSSRELNTTISLISTPQDIRQIDHTIVSLTNLLWNFPHSLGCTEPKQQSIRKFVIEKETYQAFQDLEDDISDTTSKAEFLRDEKFEEGIFEIALELVRRVYILDESGHDFACLRNRSGQTETEIFRMFGQLCKPYHVLETRGVPGTSAQVTKNVMQITRLSTPRLVSRHGIENPQRKSTAQLSNTLTGRVTKPSTRGGRGAAIAQRTSTLINSTPISQRQEQVECWKEFEWSALDD